MGDDEVTRADLQEVHKRIDDLITAMNKGFDGIKTVVAGQYQLVSVDLATVKERASQRQNASLAIREEVGDLKRMVKANVKFRYAFIGALALLTFMIPATVAVTAMIVRALLR